jgi:hypothetical protein
VRELRTARNGKGRHGTCGRKFGPFSLLAPAPLGESTWGAPCSAHCGRGRFESVGTSALEGDSPELELAREFRRSYESGILCRGEADAAGSADLTTQGVGESG